MIFKTELDSVGWKISECSHQNFSKLTLVHLTHVVVTPTQNTYHPSLIKTCAFDFLSIFFLGGGGVLYENHSTSGFFLIPHFDNVNLKLHKSGWTNNFSIIDMIIFNELIFLKTHIHIIYLEIDAEICEYCNWN